MIQELELYVHIPFCEKKCDYCDFLSFPRADKSKDQDVYVKALIREILSWKDRGNTYLVKTIFIGGGTPSLLTNEQTRDLFQAIREVFPLDHEAEITIEANPGTVTKEKLECYHSLGINRLSFGLQSTSDEELKQLGRIHTFETFLQSYQEARAAGFTNINIDLMAALPGQTLSSYEDTLHRVAALTPEHISAYSLIIEEDTPFYERFSEEGHAYKPDSERLGNERLPSEEEDRLMYVRTKELLREYGYQRYEISNYAKEGFACAHNVGYWRRKNYLGLGIGAASLLSNVRMKNTKDFAFYVAHADDRCIICEEEETLTQQEQIEETLFLGLRMCEGVSKKDFYHTFGTTLETVYGNVIKKMKEQGLLIDEVDAIYLTDSGIDVSNMCLAEFLL